MSDEVKETNVAAVSDVETLENRRATRDLKFWLVKVVTSTAMFVFTASVLSLLYAAVVQEKDLNSGFIGTLFQSVFDFLRFLMS